MTLLLDDDDLRRLLRPDDAVRWTGEAIDAHHAGRLLSPARVHADLGDARLVLTAGRVPGEWFGYRSYDTTAAAAGNQVVVVHDEASRAVLAIAVGNELGPRRTGAIGGVAAAALAPPGPVRVGLVGGGRQARTQLWALQAVREIAEVRVFTRDAERRTTFAAGESAVLGVAVRAVGSPDEAVEGAHVVVLATNSPEPVVRAAAIAPGALVTALGPKQQGRSELDPALVARAGLLVTDSAAQLAGYDPPHVLSGTPDAERVVTLGAVRAGEVPAPAADAVRLFPSVGLAGTEPYLLRALAAR